MNIFIVSCFLLTSFLNIGIRAQNCGDKGKPLTTSARLKTNLLCGYDRTVRPVRNQQSVVNVSVRIDLKYYQYDTFDSTFTVDSYIMLFWIDEFLTWNPDNYEQIDIIRLHTSEIWVPDIAINNRRTESGNGVIIQESNCLVYNSGRVLCVAPNRETILCTADLTYFPFDQQQCSLWLESLVHSSDEILIKNVNQTYITLDEMIENGQWRLFAVYTDRDLIKEDINYINYTFSSLSLYFDFIRMPHGYVAIIFIPMLTLFVITLSSLWMNPLRPERLILCCINLICHFLFIEFVAWLVPFNGEKIAVMLTSVKNLLTLATLITVFTIGLRTMMESKSDPPNWVSATVEFVVKRRRQLFLLNSDLLKATNARAESDEGTITDNPETSNINQDWFLFAKMLDRISFIVTAILYFLLFL